LLLILKSIDQYNSFAEAAAFDGHDHVDGVEVFLTAEASGEISFWVGGGVKL
jgi:hypothetical protein